MEGQETPPDPINDLCFLLVNRFQKNILLIVQYKYLKSCSDNLILQNLILRTRSCGTGFVTHPSWLLRVHPTKMVWRKCFVPLRDQLRRGMSVGSALKCFCMIHRVVGLGMAMVGITPTASQLIKIGKMQSGGCQLCRRAREARGESTHHLAVGTHGHVK